MTIQEFINEAASHIRTYLDRNGDTDVTIEIKEVTKINDNVQHGFCLLREGQDAGVNVYLDDFYERHAAGEPMTMLMTEIEVLCGHVLKLPLPPVDCMTDLGLDNIRSKLTLRLIDAKKNEKFIADRPYIDAGNGFALTADINSKESILSKWTLSVTEDVLGSIGCSDEELLTAAMENTLRLEPPCLTEMLSVLANGTSRNFLEASALDESDFTGPLMLTNNSQWKGAAALFYPNIQETLSELLHGSYYALPISIHEMLIFPEWQAPNADALCEMLYQGNRSGLVLAGDVLSDRVLYYKASAKKLLVVNPEAA